MEKIDYIEGGTELLDDVQPLWEKQKLYHTEVSPHFSEKFSQITFDVRREAIIAKAKSVKVYLARLKVSGHYIGYCVTTVDQQNIGEIDSIYVEQPYRKRGIGETLMQKALMWLDGEHVVSKRLVVVVGNEHVSAFYRKFGFFPQSIVFAQKTTQRHKG